MPSVAYYTPAIRCAKCGHAPDTWARSYDSRTGQRAIRVRCHGEVADVPFVTEPGQTVDVFGPDDAKADDGKDEPEPVLILTDKPQPTATIQGLGQFDRKLSHAVAETNREYAMKDVQGLPGALTDIVTALNTSARDAMARLQKAKDGHSAAVQRVHAVADVVETATRQTDDLINQMMGGNGGPALAPLSESTGSSQQSAA